MYGKRYVTGLGDFLVAGRKLGTFIGVATLAATEIGTITFMYNAQLGFKTGFSSFIVGLISGAVMIFIGRTGFLVKKMRAMGIMTVPEFFEARYSRNLRILTGVLVAIGGILNMGVFLKVEGTFLLLISGLSRDYLKEMMTGILILELLYTVLGGMVSIVITDFIQFVFLGIGTILITGFTIYTAGLDHMYQAVMTTSRRGGIQSRCQRRLRLGLTSCSRSCCGWPWIPAGRRRRCARSRRKIRRPAARCLQWTGFIFLGRGMMPMLWGIGALAMLGPGADSLEAMPVMIAKILPVGVLGLVTAGMLAATMSVNSSYLLGWSSVIAQDIVGPARKKPLSPKGADPAEPRDEPVCQSVRAVLGDLVYAAGTGLLLPEYHGHDLPCRRVCGGDGRALLEPREHGRRL